MYFFTFRQNLTNFVNLPEFNFDRISNLPIFHFGEGLGEEVTCAPLQPHHTPAYSHLVRIDFGLN